MPSNRLSMWVIFAKIGDFEQFFNFYRIKPNKWLNSVVYGLNLTNKILVLLEISEPQTAIIRGLGISFFTVTIKIVLIYPKTKSKA